MCFRERTPLSSPAARLLALDLCCGPARSAELLPLDTKPWPGLTRTWRGAMLRTHGVVATAEGPRPAPPTRPARLPRPTRSTRPTRPTRPTRSTTPTGPARPTGPTRPTRAALIFPPHARCGDRASASTQLGCPVRAAIRRTARPRLRGLIAGQVARHRGVADPYCATQCRRGANREDGNAMHVVRTDVYRGDVRAPIRRGARQRLESHRRRRRLAKRSIPPRLRERNYSNV